MGEFAIRPAAAADAEAISSVIVATLRASNAGDYPPEVVARVAAGFALDAVRGMIARRRVRAACAGGRIVGTAALEGDAVRSVFVLPEVQRRGVAAALMAEVFRMAEGDALSRLRLHSSLTAQGFYERLGFVATGEVLFGEERTVAMERNLRPVSTPGGGM